MARGGNIEIPVAVDAGGVEKQINNDLIKPIESAEKALEKLGDTDAGRDIDKAMDKAQDATKDLSKELDATRKDLDKLGYAAKDAGDDGARGMGKIKDAGQEVSQEIGSNLGEAVSSIRGDMSDLGQVGQDTLGGLAATLASAGPAGIAGAAALAAGAVGLGLITAEIQASEERAEKLRDRLSAAYQEAAQAGRDYLDVSQLIGEANDLMFNPERAEEYKKVREEAKLLNLDESLLIKANAGDLQSQALVQQEINRFLESTEAHLDGVYGKNKGLSDEANNLKDRWNEISEATKLQAAAAENSRKVTSDFLLQAAADAGTATEGVDAFNNKLLTLPSGEQIVIDAETGQAHQDLDRFKGDVDGIANTVATKTIKVSVDDSEYIAFRSRVQNNVLKIPTASAPPKSLVAWQ